METYKKEIKEAVDRFYVDCVEEFKEAQLRIAAESKFRSIFRKKNYDGNVKLLRECKKKSRALKFPAEKIPREDKDAKELVRLCEGCIRQFNRLCDSYIQMQLALQNKANGQKLTYSEYTQIYHKTQEDQQAMNQQLRELDLVYTEFLDAEDVDVYEFL